MPLRATGVSLEQRIVKLRNIRRKHLICKLLHLTYIRLYRCSRMMQLSSSASNMAEKLVNRSKRLMELGLHEPFKVL